MERKTIHLNQEEIISLVGLLSSGETEDQQTAKYLDELGNHTVCFPQWYCYLVRLTTDQWTRVKSAGVFLNLWQEE